MLHSRHLIALLIPLVLCSVAVAFPPFTVDAVTDHSITIGNLDCGTRYALTVRENLDGKWVDRTVVKQSTQACPPPPSSEFPTPATTGTPADWVPQSTTSSNITLSQDGQILQDVRLTNGADITVTGQNVTIRRVELDGGIINNQPGSACGNGLLVEDASLLGPDSDSSQEAAIRYGGYTARRVEIQDRHEGFRVSSQPACGPVTIEDSFAHITPPSPCGDWHGDGIQGYDGSAVTVRNVTIDMRTSGCYGTAPFFYPRNQGNTGPATIDHMLVMGQGYSFRLGMQGSVQGLRIVDGSWIFGPVDVYCPALTSWEASRVTIDANYNITSTGSAIPCTGSGT
jgi:hypothetical protein